MFEVPLLWSVNLSFVLSTYPLAPILPSSPESQSTSRSSSLFIILEEGKKERKVSTEGNGYTKAGKKAVLGANLDPWSVVTGDWTGDASRSRSFRQRQQTTPRKKEQRTPGEEGRLVIKLKKGYHGHKRAFKGIQEQTIRLNSLQNKF